LLNCRNNETLSAKIFETKKEATHHNMPYGTIVSDEKSFLKVAGQGGFLNIKSLQLEGKKRLCIEEFLRGFKNIGSYRFV
jgi:methionyl-tRNA formyltransferase